MLLSIGDQVKPGTYRLHSRFSRAINFERAGRLVSVVDETIGPGPLNIVLPSLNELHHSAQAWDAQSQGRASTLGKGTDRGLDFGRATIHGTASPATLRVTRNAVLFVAHRHAYATPQHHSIDNTCRPSPYPLPIGWGEGGPADAGPGEGIP